MNKIIKNTFLVIFCGLPIWLMVGGFLFHLSFFTMFFPVESISLHTQDEAETVIVYKRAGKPFLLVGPYHFSADYYDFFFVSQDYVVRTATDKDGGWFRFLGVLFIFDDLTSWDRTRMPYWLDADKNDGKIISNKEKKQYEYNLFLGDDRDELVGFAIPMKYFTSDMPDAENYLDHENIPPPLLIKILKRLF